MKTVAIFLLLASIGEATLAGLVIRNSPENACALGLGLVFAAVASIGGYVSQRVYNS